MLSRHSLLHLSAAGWASARPQVDPTHHAAIDRWCEADWPVIARRHEADCPADQVCVGLALPPDALSGVKHRLPLRIGSDQVTRLEKPRLLGDVLPVSWKVSLPEAALLLPVFGSVALQAITGLPYLHAKSDLDVLLQPTSRAALDAGLALLVQLSRQLPLDGEIIFPSGDAVAWEEWRAAATKDDDIAERVLAKRFDGVRLVRVDALLASLEAA